MNISKTFLLITIVAVGIFVFSVFSKNKVNSVVANNSAQSENSSGDIWESRIDTQGTVTVKVTPIELSSKVTEWKFDVGLNTHSLELDQDMTKVAVLIDDKGNEYKPVAWEGAPVGGHHREGILTFGPIAPLPKSVELKIFNIDAPVRSFVWNIID